MSYYPASRNNKKGMTLIEVVTSTLIVAVLSAGVFGAFCGAHYLLNRARHRMQAYNFATEALDKLKSSYVYYDSEMDIANDYHASDIGCAMQGEMLELAPLDTDFTYDVAEPETDGYKQITVKVKWNEPAF